VVQARLYVLKAHIDSRRRRRWMQEDRRLRMDTVRQGPMVFEANICQ
jgi:hypothetical protein